MRQTLCPVFTTLALAATLALGAADARSDEVRATVAEMLSDAETRSSLLAGGDAGHDGKFFIAGDGFRLNIGGAIQLRYYLNFRDDSTDDDFNSGFRARRTKLIFSGVVEKKWDFYVQGDFAGSEGSFVLDDAWAQYSCGNGVKIKFGQFKTPLLREELVSDWFQLTAERSLVNSAYTQSRSQGVQLSYAAEHWRIAAAVDDGLNAKNTDFVGAEEDTSKFKVSGQAAWAVTGRFEWLVDGAWKQMDDFTSPRGSAFAAMLGLAAHFQQSDNTSDPADVDRDTFEYTADLSLEGDGWDVYGAFIGRHTGLRETGADTDYDDFGAVVQGGFYVWDRTEIFARWEALFVDGDRPGGTGRNDFHFLTVGFAHFFAGHAVQWTTDMVWSCNDTSRLQTLGILPDSGIGLLGQAEENEIVFRSQFQLLF